MNRKRNLVGLLAPETIDKTIEMHGSPNKMRVYIEQGGRNSVLISKCLETAAVQGLSGEDKYTLLAYHALVLLEENTTALMKFIEEEEPLRNLSI